MYKKTFIFKDEKAYKRFIDKIGCRVLYSKNKGTVITLDNNNSKKYEKEALNACKIAIRDLKNEMVNISDNYEKVVFKKVIDYILKSSNYSGPDKVKVILSEIKRIPKNYLENYEIATIYRDLINDLEVIKNKK